MTEVVKFNVGDKLYTENGELNEHIVSSTPSGASEAIYILLSENSYSEPTDFPSVLSGTEISIGSEFISGNGKESTIDVVVGNGSSVIDFTIRNNGYRYKLQESLTIPINGL